MIDPNKNHGPKIRISKDIHKMKYRLKDESFREAMSRVANTLADDDEHFQEFRNILLNQKFLPAGRVQAAIGSPRRTTAFNCFVSGRIEDSMNGIMDKAKDAAATMRLGGGIGYDFSTLRPKGDLIISLDSKASGSVSFMHIFDSVCKTVSSAGNRRGAQMGVLRVDHPDIEEFIEAKTNSDNLTAFNISVGVTDEFMRCVIDGKEFDLKFDGRTFKRVDARYLWDKIMRSTWDWAEPGVLYIDRINDMNNLWYCETISATNPCGEQPLPPYGACLLGSFNLVKYLVERNPELPRGEPSDYFFDWDQFKSDIREVVRAMDNIIDNTIYPLPEQEAEAKSKRRMGLGVTALANAGEILGEVYGSPEFLAFEEEVLKTLANEAYRTSAMLANEKGTFPLYNEFEYNRSKFLEVLDQDVRALIREVGVRNSHLLSIAPTGTISLSADNVSSGCEPVFSHYYDRTIQTEDGPIIERVEDYAYREFGICGKTADECSIADHLNVLVIASKWVDSAVSKTINVGDHITWDEFKDIYMEAWKRGCKGVTTFRAAGKRYGILNKVKEEKEEDLAAEACYYDPETGKKQCE